MPSTCAERARDQVARAASSSAAIDVSSVPLPSIGIEITATVSIRVDADVDRPVHQLGGEGLLAQVLDRPDDLGIGDVVGLDDDHERDLPARERGLHALVRLHDRQAVGDALDAAVDRVQPQAGDRERDQQPTGEHRRDERTPQHAVEDRRPRRATRRRRGGAGDATNGTRPFSTRSPSFESTAGRTVSEPSIATATTRIVPTANDMNVALPVRNMPGHRDHHGEPGDEHGAARGRGGDRQRGLVGVAGPPLLPLAAQVEQRVVDADREADQQDHRRDLLVDGEQLAHRPEDARASRTRPSGRAAAGHPPPPGRRTRRPGSAA